MARPRNNERRLVDTPRVGGSLDYPTRVRNFRLLHHFTQADAAEWYGEWYGVSTREWQRYESGDVVPPRPLRKRIVAYVQRACPEYLHFVT
jgi:hypothetical protein